MLCLTIKRQWPRVSCCTAVLVIAGCLSGHVVSTQFAVGGPSGATTTFLSDKAWVSATAGFGTVNKDRSSNGTAITIRGVTYAKGIGTHAVSDIHYNIAGACTTLTATIGIDDETTTPAPAGNSTVIFQILTDGVKIYDSGILNRASAAVTFSASLTGKNDLELMVADAGDGITADHADWANARLTCVPPSVNTFLSDSAWVTATAGFGTVNKDKSSNGTPLIIRGVTYAKGIGTHAVSDIHYNVASACTRLTATVGIDDETVSPAPVGSSTVIFQVFADTVKLYDSGILNRASTAQTLSVDLTGRNDLRLLVADDGDGISADHADWANAIISCAPTTPPGSGVTITPTDDINTIVQANPAGTTFNLTAGVWRLPSNISAKNGDIFNGAGVNSTYINGSRLLTTWVDQGNGTWAASGQTQSSTIDAGQCTGGPANAYLACGYREELFEDDVALIHGSSQASINANTWWFDYTNHIIYIGFNPATHKVETSIQDHLFEQVGSGVTIQKMTIEKFATPHQYGVINASTNATPPVTTMPNWTIQDSVIQLCHGVSVITGDGMKLLRSKFNYMGQLGIGGHGANVVMQSNEIGWNNRNYVSSQWEAGGTKLVYSTDALIKWNYSHDNHGPGLWTDTGNIRSVYDGNLVINNDSAGIMHEVNDNSTCVIMNNRVVNNGGNDQNGTGFPFQCQIYIPSSPGCDIHDNIMDVFGGGENAVALAQYNNVGHPLETNENFHNNTMIFRNSGVALAGPNGYGDTTQLYATLTWDYNNAHALNVNDSHYQWKSVYQSLAGIQAQGADIHGTMDGILPGPTDTTKPSGVP
ncbi:MAG: hypothetical protein NVS9B4_00930 [Candidatus Acidiferrum sp.]